LQTDTGFLIDLHQQQKTDPPAEKISEYVEGHRILPPGTPFAGPWQNSRTPYSVEIMDNASPFSPIIYQAIMKAAQLGLTAAAENIIAYWMDEYPTEVLYVSATETGLEKWSTKRLDPLIDSCGFRERIYAQTESKGSRRTGDKIFSKQFLGGALDMVSAQSASGLRSDSKRIVIIDEVDGAPKLLRTGEGIYLKVVWARTNAWSHKKKVTAISTPTTFEDSLIYQEYLQGDQRKFIVPCPLCGEEQILEFERLKPDTKAGKLINVYYECPKCEEALFNHHKNFMLNNGVWRPQITEISKQNMRSYQIGSIYSPVGMFSWMELYQEYLDAQSTPDGMASFTQLYLGEPYQEKGARPDLQKVIELVGVYNEGKIPDGVLFLTMSVDVQQGNKDDPHYPPRLEMEILGVGSGYRTWSILYKVFRGPVDDPFSGAWEDLYEFLMEGGATYKRSDGMDFTVQIGFVDSGDGENYDVVFRWCERVQNIFPCKGFGSLKKRKTEKGDQVGIDNFKRYRAASTKRSGGATFYEVSTNYYKTHIYNNLRIQREGDPRSKQRPGFCDFPVERGSKYFEMLTAEEKRKDGSFFAGGRRNEALDLRVYALCAADVWLDAKVMDMKAAAKAAGASPTELQTLNHRFLLDVMEQDTARKTP
jgi:phage terminase large subunit GpA-like protein